MGAKGTYVGGQTTGLGANGQQGVPRRARRSSRRNSTTTPPWRFLVAAGASTSWAADVLSSRGFRGAAGRPPEPDAGPSPRRNSHFSPCPRPGRRRWKWRCDPAPNRLCGRLKPMTARPATASAPPGRRITAQRPEALRDRDPLERSAAVIATEPAEGGGTRRWDRVRGLRRGMALDSPDFAEIAASTAFLRPHGDDVEHLFAYEAQPRLRLSCPIASERRSTLRPRNVPAGDTSPLADLSARLRAARRGNRLHDGWCGLGVATWAPPRPVVLARTRVRPRPADEGSRATSTAPASTAPRLSRGARRTQARGPTPKG